MNNKLKAIKLLLLALIMQFSLFSKEKVKIQYHQNYPFLLKKNEKLDFETKFAPIRNMEFLLDKASQQHFFLQWNHLKKYETLSSKALQIQMMNLVHNPNQKGKVDLPNELALQVVSNAVKSDIASVQFRIKNLTSNELKFLNIDENSQNGLDAFIELDKLSPAIYQVQALSQNFYGYTNTSAVYFNHYKSPYDKKVIDSSLNEKIQLIADSTDKLMDQISYVANYMHSFGERYYESKALIKELTFAKEYINSAAKKNTLNKEYSKHLAKELEQLNSQIEIIKNEQNKNVYAIQHIYMNMNAIATVNQKRNPNGELLYSVTPNLLSNPKVFDNFAHISFEIPDAYFNDYQSSKNTIDSLNSIVISLYEREKVEFSINYEKSGLNIVLLPLSYAIDKYKLFEFKHKASGYIANYEAKDSKEKLIELIDEEIKGSQKKKESYENQAMEYAKSSTKLIHQMSELEKERELLNIELAKAINEAIKNEKK